MIDATAELLTDPSELTAEKVADLEDFTGLSIEQILAMGSIKSQEVFEGIRIDPLDYHHRLIKRVMEIEGERLGWAPAVLADFWPPPHVCPGWVRFFCERTLKRGRAEAAVDLDRLSRFLDGRAEPLLPNKLRPSIAAAMLQNGGTAADIEKMDRLLFVPWVSRGALHQLKAEIDRHRPGAGESAEATSDFERFLTDACLRAPGAAIRPKDLFRHYQAWTASAGVEAMGKQAFYKILSSCAPEVRRGRPKGPDGKQSTTIMLIGIRAR